MSVEFVVGDLSDESPVIIKNLVAWRVAGKFVEPIATCECLFPYFCTSEFLEVFDPHIPIYLLDMFQGRHSCDVRSG